MYGLEVCKSLNLPNDFLEKANDIRRKYFTDSSVLTLKASHYNSKKIINVCEVCNMNLGSEIHHLIYQENANENGTIITDNLIFHKNNLANLITLCNECHKNIHKKDIKQSVKAGIGSFIGVLFSIVIKLGINVGIVIYIVSKLI
jgi:DNA mismatch repair protein MutS